MVKRPTSARAWRSAICAFRAACWSRSGSRCADRLLTLYLSKTFTGRAIKAVAQDEAALRLMGANPVRIKQWAFGIATAVLGLAGAMLIIVAPVDADAGPRLYRTDVLRGGAWPASAA